LVDFKEKVWGLMSPKEKITEREHLPGPLQHQAGLSVKPTFSFRRRRESRLVLVKTGDQRKWIFASAGQGQEWNFLLDKFLEIKYLLTKLNIFNFPFDERDRRKTESLPIGESNDPQTIGQ
jgi:hypothetical protein